MKCPKCSYTSFDYLDACKKCGTERRDVRSRLQIIAVSPEERALTPGSAREEPSPGASQAAAASPIRPGADLSARGPEAGASDDALLTDLNFEESFEGIVEPTSYRDPPKQSLAPKAPAPDDDELLDLDFGDVFAEKEEEK
jgi:hypothetical protein